MTIELPTPDFELLWKSGEYKVTKSGIESAKCYTAEQMRAYGEACTQAEREACANVCGKVEQSNIRAGLREQAFGAGDCEMNIRIRSYVLKAE